MHLTTPEFHTDVPIDAMLVLGRGIGGQGDLSETSKLRAEMALEIAFLALPRVVVFSGGHSWVQEREGVYVPSEGGAMLMHAIIRLGELGLADELKLAGVSLLAEEESTSTTGNMVNSKPMLGLSKGDTLAILTDGLHNQEGRVGDLARLVFPGQHICIIDTVPNTPLPGAEKEEKLATLMTKVFMFGVQPGNDKAIMRRQRCLEMANAAYRTLRDQSKKILPERP